MAEGRPSFPKELSRRVLIEAGHRCAIPSCRHIEVEIHHIVPWEQCKKHEYENLIALCPNCHQRADRQAIDRKSLRIYKANLRYTHDRFSQFEVDTLFEAYRLGVNEGIPWPPYLMLLIKRLLDAGYLNVHRESGGVWIAGMQANPDYLVISTKGKEYIESLNLDRPEESDS